MQQPSIGRIVHYVSHGTPPREDGSQAHTSECRAAIIAGIPPRGLGEDDRETVQLAVLNPAGVFFDTAWHDEEEKSGGTWHWPERV